MANPATAPDVAVANLLAAATSLTKGTDLFHGPMRPYAAGQFPHLCVFCLASGGPAPEPYFGNAADFRQMRVQVLIRSNVDAYAAGQTTAFNCWLALQRATSTGYVTVTVNESNPVYLGLDDTEHHRWAVNALLWYKG